MQRFRVNRSRIPGCWYVADHKGGAVASRGSDSGKEPEMDMKHNDCVAAVFRHEKHADNWARAMNKAQS